ncbi:MAG: NosD domain-containing protein [Candidatus Hydrothermarchaeales archaeon]
MKKIISTVTCLLILLIITGTINAISCGETITTDTTLENDLKCPTGHGIIIGADGITIDGAGHTIKGKNGAGIELESRKDVTIKNLKIENFVYGIYLKLSRDNTIINTTFSNNYFGIMFELSSNNKVLNNYFNNRNNILHTSSSNKWSTVKREGENIVGGPYLGGNFWGKPDGTGYSETCDDEDGDWICDEGYYPDNLNVDNFPLIIYHETLLTKSAQNNLKIIIPLAIAGIIYLVIRRGNKKETIPI